MRPVDTVVSVPSYNMKCGNRGKVRAHARRTSVAGRVRVDAIRCFVPFCSPKDTVPKDDVSKDAVVEGDVLQDTAVEYRREVVSIGAAEVVVGGASQEGDVALGRVECASEILLACPAVCV